MKRSKKKNLLRPEQIICIAEVDRIMATKPSISKEELMEIMENFCKKNGFSLND